MQYQENKFIGTQFRNNMWADYQTYIKKILKESINEKYTNSIFIDLTWFGPQYNNGEYDKVIEYNSQGIKFDDAFLLSSVDPCHLNKDELKKLAKLLGNPVMHLIGNFDNEYRFDFFAPILAKHFKSYNDDELLMTDLKYRYINYNRKPREHRVKFMNSLIKNDLIKYGVNTIGKPDHLYDKDETNALFMSIGEKCKDYIQWGHWMDKETDDKVGIPHDVLSLHNMYYWKHHFLYIVGATEFLPWDDIFVSETQYKPMIGLRPFVINGNTRTYKWLRDRGFKTFNHYFSGIDIENTHEDSVHPHLIKVLQYLVNMTDSEIIEMYNDMLPDLKHNRERFYEYADEEYVKVDNLIK